MENPMIRQQADADTSEDLRRRQAILKERYCTMCLNEVGPDYELVKEDCEDCSEPCCQHMGSWVEFEWAEFEMFLCYECQEIK